MSARPLLGMVVGAIGCAGGGVAVPVGTFHVPPAAAGTAFCEHALVDSTVYDTTQLGNRPVLYEAGTLHYPKGARRRGVQGRVLLAVTVNDDGRPDSRSLQALSSPDSELTRAALEWVRDAKFMPVCHNGAAVRVRVAVPVDFKLDS